MNKVHHQNKKIYLLLTSLIKNSAIPKEGILKFNVLARVDSYKIFAPNGRTTILYQDFYEHLDSGSTASFIYFS